MAQVRLRAAPALQVQAALAVPQAAPLQALAVRPQAQAVLQVAPAVPAALPAVALPVVPGRLVLPVMV